MARDLMDENYYISGGGMIPIKWTAPEVRCGWQNLYISVLVLLTTSRLLRFQFVTDCISMTKSFIIV